MFECVVIGVISSAAFVYICFRFRNRKTIKYSSLGKPLMVPAYGSDIP